MHEDTVVACDICGLEVIVAHDALRFPETLRRALPGGWTLTWQRDEETGTYVRVVRCPKHRP